ncbi:hypothetical protein INT43_008290 [Umbelopsis isabellina]|uniref:glycogenin glucosyltransferase n=1 Tax=Mortierella isabellina TaxID=91625 RepID=A0A8H7U9K9_MORIS|nr:hypothetical protein INT43_008290 [Umbelopsis isabellina]
MVRNEAYVTLLVTDSYAPGALVVANTLREYGTTREIAVMVTSNITEQTRDLLKLSFDRIIDIDKKDSGQLNELSLLGRPELGVTWSKLAVWQLDYDKVVFLDADVLPLRLVDELFDRPEFSAAPDAGWPDCFNSGVFVAVPNAETYKELCALATSKGSFDGGDQGLLNTYFSSWATSAPEHRLPFTYNTTPTAVYSYVPAYRVNRDKVAIAHFIGTLKPWHVQQPFSSGHHSSSQEEKLDLVQQWWLTYNRYYGTKPTTETAPLPETVTVAANDESVAANASSTNPNTSSSASQPPKLPVFDPAVPPNSKVKPVFPWEQNRSEICTRVWYD